MIEVKMIWNDDDDGPDIDISIYQPFVEDDFNFDVASYEIGGIVFTEWSEEMQKTLDQMDLIDKLSM